MYLPPKKGSLRSKADNVVTTVLRDSVPGRIIQARQKHKRALAGHKTARAIGQANKDRPSIKARQYGAEPKPKGYAAPVKPKSPSLIGRSTSFKPSVSKQQSATPSLSSRTPSLPSLRPTAPQSGNTTYNASPSGRRNIRVKMPWTSGERYRKGNRPVSPLQAQINENNKLLSAPVAKGDNIRQRRATRQFLVNNANSDLVTKAMGEQGATHRAQLQGEYSLAREKMSGENQQQTARIRGKNGLAISTQNNKGEDNRLTRKIDSSAKEGALDRENDREVAREKTIRDSFISGVDGDDVQAMRGHDGKVDYTGKAVPRQQATKSQWKQETDEEGNITGYYDPITNQRRLAADWNDTEVGLGLSATGLTAENFTPEQESYLVQLSKEDPARYQRIIDQRKNPSKYI